MSSLKRDRPVRGAGAGAGAGPSTKKKQRTSEESKSKHERTHKVKTPSFEEKDRPSKPHDMKLSSFFAMMSAICADKACLCGETDDLGGTCELCRRATCGTGRCTATLRVMNVEGEVYDDETAQVCMDCVRTSSQICSGCPTMVEYDHTTAKSAIQCTECSHVTCKECQIHVPCMGTFCDKCEDDAEERGHGDFLGCTRTVCMKCARNLFHEKKIFKIVECGTCDAAVPIDSAHQIFVKHHDGTSHPFWVCTPCEQSEGFYPDNPTGLTCRRGCDLCETPLLSDEHSEFFGECDGCGSQVCYECATMDECGAVVCRKCSLVTFPVAEEE